jgi:glycosyltransferase involved in cell wall biosynthesis
MEVPSVSVIMSVWNDEKFLSDAIASILNQSYNDFEFIIVNDGSTDDSMNIVETYASRDNRIRIINQRNKGLTRALNVGIQESRGQYIARMDADDISYSERFALQVQYLEENPDCVLVGGQVELIDENGARIFSSPIIDIESTTGRMEHLMLDHADIDQALLSQHWPLVHPAIMMRRQAVRDVGGYHEKWKILQDHDLFLKLAEVGQLANLPDVVLQYRRRPGQATKKSTVHLVVKRINRRAYKRRGRPIPSHLTRLNLLREAIRIKLEDRKLWRLARFIKRS